MTQCFVGLGSNLSNPVHQVESAFRELDALPDTRVVATSSLYRSAPLGPPDQADYVNAVAELETALEACDLLDRLQDIEHQHGRVRAERWGPRTLDLDLLLYGEQSIVTPRLVVPHPEIPNRNFVLVPLWELAPRLTVPGMGRVSEMMERLGDVDLQVIAGDAKE